MWVLPSRSPTKPLKKSNYQLPCSADTQQRSGCSSITACANRSACCSEFLASKLMYALLHPTFRLRHLRSLKKVRAVSCVHAAPPASLAAVLLPDSSTHRCQYSSTSALVTDPPAALIPYIPALAFTNYLLAGLLAPDSSAQKSRCVTRCAPTMGALWPGPAWQPSCCCSAPQAQQPETSPQATATGAAAPHHAALAAPANAPAGAGMALLLPAAAAM